MRTFSGSFDPNDLDVLVLDERVEGTDRVTAASDTCDDRVGELARQVGHLRLDLVSDHRLEVAHDRRERSGTDRRTDEVVRRREVRHPVPHSLVDGVFEGSGSRCDRDDLGSEHPHPENVQRLATHVLLSHVDNALHAELGAHGRSRDTVLTCSRLGDDALLSDATREQDLTDRVVDLFETSQHSVSPRQQSGKDGDCGG